jgi:hypothetical protein
MKRFAMLFAVGVCLAGAAVAQAQETMMSPPKVLTTIREVEKPGKSAAHADWEAGYPRAFAKANWPTHYLALRALTGEPRVLFLMPFDSLAAWEKEGMALDNNASLTADVDRLDAKDGDFLSESRRATLVYMPELSYHPEISVKGTRYFMIVSIHVKPGHGDQFVDVRKMVKAAHEKANLSDHYAVFRFTMGAPAGSYVIFVPMKTAAELDQWEDLHGQTYKDAQGEEGRKKLDEFNRDGLETSESQLFMFSPKMSYAPKEWAEADPEFWSPKAGTTPAAKPRTAKKEVEKKP